MREREFLIVIEKGETNYGAWSPDLLGCVAVGKTRRGAVRSMREAIALHIEGMLEDGLPIPKPTSSSTILTLQVPSKRDQSAATVKKSARLRKLTARAYNQR